MSAKPVTRPAWIAVCLASILPTLPARADATITIEPRGEAFSDTTPAAPVGGNSGTTLGAQRLIALQYAAKLWGAELDSNAPIAIDVAFADLGCSSNGATLAHAGPESAINGLEGEGADPALWYAAALANRLAGEDLWPGQAEIGAEFNSAVDNPDCQVGGWYYGLDGKGGSKNDLVEVALHEFGHGLGFTSLTNVATGEMIGPSQTDSFTAQLFDNQLNQRWPNLTDVQRAASALSVRGVAWNGPRVTSAVADFLGTGAPSLLLSPLVADFSGFVADAGFSTFRGVVTAPVVIADNVDGCIPPSSGSLAGKIVFYEPWCAPDDVAEYAKNAGAIGVLMAAASNIESPAAPLPEATRSVTIPVLSLSPADGARIKQALAAGTLDATLTLDPARRKGTDAAGRALMFTSQPLLTGSAVSHFDILARPDLLMEPFASAVSRHQVDLTKALMIDIGWAPFCGNGRIDRQEACDQGALNSNQTVDGCRLDCTKARCGDGVRDSAESCDQGAKNSDVTADACRTSCTMARCGDGVVDATEACDQGASNSDVAPDACRTTCQKARCGDGVVDRDESCDGKGCTAQCTPPAVEPDADAGLEPQVQMPVPEAKSKDDGCGCRIPGGRQNTSSTPLAVTLLGLAFAWQRRARRRARRDRSASA